MNYSINIRGKKSKKTNSLIVEKPKEIPVCETAGGIKPQTIRFLLYNILEQN